MSRLRAILVGTGGGLILAVGLTATMDAQAVYCCDPWGIPGANAFISAGSNVVRSITQAVTNVVREVETGALYTFNQGVGKATTEMSKQTASNRVIAGGSIEAEAQVYLEEARADATEAAVEPAMLDETVPNALMVAEGQEAKAKIVRRYDAQLADSLVEGPYANTTALVDRHLSKYCDYRNVSSGICDKQAIDDMQNADATVATIYGGTSLTYSDEERDAALAAVQLIVAPEPLRAVANGSDTSQGQRFDAYLLTDQAALALAGHVLHSQVADRTRKRDTE